MSIRRSTLRHNWTGATPDDNTELVQNSIYCNSFGVHIASEDTPVQYLGGNNVCHSLEHSFIAWQDAADATDTFWCTTDLAEIAASIRDARDDLDMAGEVAFDPPRSTPVVGAPPLP